jgi:hypothetical protein
VLVCLLTFCAGLASLCLAEEIESPAHYDGDDDDAGIDEKRFAPPPILEAALLAYQPEVPPLQRLERPAPDRPEPPRRLLHRRPAPRGPPA